MSLYVCEIKNTDEVEIVRSRFLKKKTKLMVGPEAGCTCKLVSDTLFDKEEKHFFPVFESMLFSKNPKADIRQNQFLVFFGIETNEGESADIAEAIEEFQEKERIEYEKYKNRIDQDIAILLGTLKNGIDQQKAFFEEGILSDLMFEETMGTMENAYQDILHRKIAEDPKLLQKDQEDKILFYVDILKSFIRSDEEPAV